MARKAGRAVTDGAFHLGEYTRVGVGVGVERTALKQAGKAEEECRKSGGGVEDQFPKPACSAAARQPCPGSVLPMRPLVAEPWSPSRPVSYF